MNDGKLVINTPRGTIKVLADGGKCPGWLLPPDREADTGDINNNDGFFK
jgi:hypothetical protein